MMILKTAIVRILGPMARLLIARGVQFAEFNDWAKDAYLSAAQRYFQLDGKRVTDSRLHLLTGLQRKDIKALRARHDQDTLIKSAGPVARVVGLWLAKHSDASGNPGPVRRLGPAPSLQALVSEISRDMHVRTVQDELTRLGLAEVQGDQIQLTQDAFLPAGDDTAMLGYLGANLGDHAAASVDNIMAAPDPGTHLERAAHYNHLSAASLDDLNAFSRQVLTDALSQINARAAELQRRDRDDAQADGRFRAGAFIYRAKDEDTA